MTGKLLGAGGTTVKLPIGKMCVYMEPMDNFAAPTSKEALERGTRLTPRYDAQGLIAAVATHVETGEVLMLAWMNEEALRRTIETREAHYFSRSRGELWRKGETSGQIQEVIEIRIDCDQDAVWMKVRPQGDGGACHVGFRSCFYRLIDETGALVEAP